MSELNPNTKIVSLNIRTSDGSVADVYINGEFSGNNTPTTLVKEVLGDVLVTLVTENVQYDESYFIGFNENNNFIVERRFNDTRTPFDITDETSSQYDLIFTPSGDVIDIDGEEEEEEESEDEDTDSTLSTITVTVNEEKSIVLESDTERITVFDLTEEVEAVTNTLYTIKSDNIDNWKIVSIVLTINDELPITYTANDDESIGLVVPIRDGIKVDVTVEPTVLTIIPQIRLNETSLDYNINSNDDLTIRTFPTNAESIIVNIGNKEYFYVVNEFDGIEGDSLFYDIRIPKQDLQDITNHIISFTPRNEFKDGQSVSLSVNSFDAVFVETPDLFNITYPTKISGADFRGTDVSFNIQWESVNTNYVRVYYGNSQNYITTVDNNILLNVGTILENIDSNEIRTDGEFIRFDIKLVPVNTDGFQDVLGRTEVLDIGFKEGDLSIPRAIAIDRIADSFLSNLDRTIFDNDSNNLLNHLLHTGNGINVLIANWIGSRDGSLIVKLYEPLPTEIQQNDLVWISKIQSNPTIQTVSLFSEIDDDYPFIKGPNFSADVDGGSSYEVVETILGSTNLSTSDKLITQYVDSNVIDTSVLNIKYNDGNTILYNNFVNFGSAKERVINFEYKKTLIHSYEDIISTLEGLSNPTIVDLNEINKNKKLRLNVISNFDGFEKFLYENNIDTNDILSSAEEYDRNNVNYLVNNIPNYLIKDTNNAEFILFLDMIGHHFDILWVYINGITDSRRNITHIGKSNSLVYHLLESFGWNPKIPFDSVKLWESALGQNKDGTSLFNIPLDSAKDEVWRRILNNLPYLLKHKGTRRSLSAMLSSYGIPSSLLTIMEFGGPNNQKNSIPTQFTFEDTTYSILFNGSSTIELDWKEFEGEYPASVEFRINTVDVTPQTLLRTMGWELNLIPSYTGSYGFIELNIDNQSVSTPILPLFTDEFNHIVVNRNISSIEIFAVRNDISDIKQIVSASIPTDTGWDVESVLKIAPDFIGQMDEFRLWRTPLSLNSIRNHSLLPNSISGNELKSSTDDLLFRLDFELPRNRSSMGDVNINNVSINQSYSASATAVGFPNITEYPFNYKYYERIVSAKVPSTGFSYSDKIRIVDTETLEHLSFTNRVSTKSLDKYPIDSNKVGIFLSPNKELNMDVIKSFGNNLSIDNLIGNPSDIYNDTYKELNSFRSYYFERLNRDIYEYIRLIRLIDKSLFDDLTDLIPARANVSKGLLIEPHILERSKVKWNKPSADTDVNESNIDILDNVFINSEKFDEDTTIKFDEVENVFVEIGSIDSTIQVNTDTNVDIENISIETDIKFDTYNDVNVESLGIETSIKLEKLSSLNTEIELDIDDYSSGDTDYNRIGFGLYATNGTASFFNTLDVFGNRTKEYRRVLVISEQNNKLVESFIPQSGSFETFTVPTFRTYITTLPITSSIDIVPNGNIISVTPLNGYLPIHYKFKNISTGLRNSFYNGSKQTENSTPDGLPPIETFTTNPNILRVADTSRGSGEPILIIS